MTLRLVGSFGPCTLQGAPAYGLRRHGVPEGGAFDQEALGVVDVLLSRPSGEAFELALGSALFQVDDDCQVCVIGAVGKVLLNGEERWQGTFPAMAGQSLEVAVGRIGARAYIGCSDMPGPSAAWEDSLQSMQNEVIRVVPGPQSDITIRPKTLTATATMDRAGIRCEPLGITHTTELPSEPACFGAIQLTPDGTPIILGPDGPTIGGYPKIAVVCSGDLNKLAQIRPGQSFDLDLLQPAMH